MCNCEDHVAMVLLVRGYLQAFATCADHTFEQLEQGVADHSSFGCGSCLMHDYQLMGITCKLTYH